jgi:hypothetical protein
MSGRALSYSHPVFKLLVIAASLFYFFLDHLMHADCRVKRGPHVVGSRSYHDFSDLLNGLGLLSFKQLRNVSNNDHPAVFVIETHILLLDFKYYGGWVELFRIL